MFHASNIRDIKMSLVSIKFLAMHYEKFRAQKLAVLFPLLQIVSSIAVEMIVSLTLLASETHQDCLENFMAMAALNQFDLFFFKVLPNNDRGII